MKKSVWQWLLILLAVLLVVPALIPFPVHANTNNGLTFSGSGVSADNDKNATLQITCKGYVISTGSNSSTITITNSTGSRATIKFNYTISGESTYSVKIRDDGVNKGVDKDGTYAITLPADGKFYVDLSCSCGRIGSGRATLSMSEIDVQTIIDSAQVQVLYNDQYGKVKMGSTVVANGDTITSTVDSPVTITAEPSSGFKFVAWADTNNNFISADPSYLLQPTAASMTIKAIFSDTTPWFRVNNGKLLVEGWDAAMAYGGTVILANNATLTARDTAYNVPSNVNLLIPYAGTDTGNFGSIPEGSPLASTANPSTYRTLTVASGASITVDGKLNVNGQRNTATQGTTGTGCAKGGHGLIDLQGSGTQLTINSDAYLYCYGFIKGTGGVALNGGTMHELLQVYDWAGGTNILSWYGSLSSKKAQTLFFTGHYYLQNVEAPLTVAYGSEMYAEGVLTVSDVQVCSSARVVGTDSADSGLFLMGSGTSITRTYSPTTDRVEYQLNGNGTVTFGSLQVNIKVVFNVSLDSAEFTLPFNNAMTLRIGDGVTMNTGNRVALMPGSRLIIDEGGTLNLSSNMYIFDKDDKAGLFFSQLWAPAYTASRGTDSRITDNTESAYLEVNGDLKITGSGGLYTTNNGGTNTDKIIYGTGTITHTGTTGSGVLRGGYTSNYVKVETVDALANLAGDGDMQSIGKNTYIGLGSDHGNKWYISTADMVPTCEEAGGTKYYCSSAEAFYKIDDPARPATGHTPGAAADCENAQTCTVCGAEVNPALGHTPGAAATCTTNQICTVCSAELNPAMGHTPNPDDNNCTTAVTCSVCGVVTTEAKDHTWVDANCTTPKTCSVCKATEGEALGHTEVVDAAVAATCTATGLTEGKHCSVCNTVLVAQEEVKKLDHTEVVDAAKNPTCTETGLTEGKHCSVCNTVLVEQTVVAATGHTAAEDDGDCTTAVNCKVCGEVVTAGATAHIPVADDSDCTTAVKCANCNQAAVAATSGHSYDSGNQTTAPSCTATGVMTYSCTVAGCEKSYPETIKATGHSYTASVTAPTCTAQGYTTHTCGNCSDSYQDTFVAALGHTEVVDAAVAPTCTATGLTEGKHCSVCGEVLIAQETVDALGHTEETIPGKAATCSETGLTEGTKCSVCEEIIEAQEVIDKLSHTEEILPGKAASCEETGLTEGKKCSVCGQIIVDQEEIPTTDHTEEVIPAVSPTCTATGLTEGKKCSACGEILTEQQTIAALGHSYDGVVTSDPTCSEAGVKTYTCGACGDTYTEAVTALGHTEVIDAAVAPTCTETGLNEGKHCSVCGTVTVAQTEVAALGHTEETISGYDKTCTTDGLTDGKRCTVCGVTTVAQEIIKREGHKWDPETGICTVETCQVQCEHPTYDAEKGVCADCGMGCNHNYGEGVVTYEATCTAPGLKTFTCDICGHRKSEEIEALGHSWIDADCDTPKTCSVCNATEGNALGHSYNSVVTAPTCTADGYTTHTCTTCGDTYTDAPATALGHNYKSVVTAPTCTAEGYTTDTCSVCGDIQIKDKVAARDHIQGETVVENNVAPDCVNTGRYDNVVYCTVCKVQLSRETVTVDAKGHKYEGIVTNPTCTEDGYTTYTCSVCQDTYQADETPATGHNYGEWEVTQQATCTDQGAERRECANCDAYETQAIPATKHEYTPVVTAPTCTEKGYTTYTCHCSHSYKADEVDALGHDYKAVVTAPTCTEAGYTTYTCHCGHSYKADEVDALGHSYKEEYTDPTFEADGFTTYTCHCGDTYTKVDEGTQLTAVAQIDDKKFQTLAEAFAAAKDDEEENIIELLVKYTVEKDRKETWNLDNDILVIPAIDNNYGLVIKGELTIEGGAFIAKGLYGIGIQPSGKLTIQDGNFAWDKENEEAASDYLIGNWGETVIEGGSFYGQYNCVNNFVTEGYSPNATVTITGGQFRTEATDSTGEYDSFDVLGDAVSISGGAFSKEVWEGDLEEGFCACRNEETKLYEVDTHSYTYEVTDPTCTEAGYTTHTCSRCGDTYTDNAVAATGHRYGNLQVHSATCTVDGYIEITCSDCQKTFKSGVDAEADQYLVDYPFFDLAAKGHTEVIDDAVAADCVNTGLTEGKHCDVCGEVIVKQEVVDALGHKHNAVVTDPTCTEQGYTTYTCSTCGDTYVSDYVAAKGHTEVIDKAVAPDCTNTGLTEGKHCSVCGEVILKQEVVSALGHKHNAVITAPTCTEQGYTTYTCSTCGDTYVSDYVAAKGHTEVIDDAVAPDCTNTGLTEGNHCDVCGEVIVKQEVVDALGHKHNAVVTDPTCTEKGYTTYTCNCGDTYTGNEVSSLGHSYGDWKIVTNATCTQDGAKKKVCACGDEVTEVIKAPGHTLTQVDAKAPTCTEAGYEAYDYCTVCGHTTFKEVAALNHDLKDVDGKDATCTEDGYTAYKDCIRCDYTEGKEILTATGHVNTTTTTVDATCTEDGSVTVTCACGHVVSTETIPAKGHTEATREENRQEATCGADGSYDLVTYCSVCQEVLKTEKQTIPATGAHVYEIETERVEETCTVDGYVVMTCSCGAKETTVLKAPGNHSFTNYVSDNNATCTADGTKTAKCNRCDEKDTITDDGSKLDHTYSEAITKAPTCADTGVKTFTCSCGDSYTKEIAATGNHDWKDATYEAPKTCSVCKLTEGEKKDRPAVDVVKPEDVTSSTEDTTITEEEVKEVAESVVEASGKVEQPTDTGIEADANKAALEEAAGGNRYDTSLVITVNSVVVAKDGESTVAKSVTYDVSPMLYVLDMTGTQISEQKIEKFESPITFRLPVEGPARAIKAQVWHEGSLLGSYEIRKDSQGNRFVEVESNSFSKFTVAPITDCEKHSYVNGKCENCGAEKKEDIHLTLDNDNMTLGNSLAINFWVYKNQMRDGVEYTAKLVRTFADGTTETSYVPMAKWVEYETYYQVVYDKFAAKEMTDTVSIQIQDSNDNVVSNVFTDSIKDYAEYMITHYTQNTELCTALVDMLNYGAAAQKEFNHNTEKLANAGLTPAQQSMATKSIEPNDHWQYSGKGYSSNLELVDRIILRIWFTGVTEDMYAVVKFTNHYGTEIEAKVSFDEFFLHNANYSTYSVPIDDLVIADGRQVVTCILYNGAHEEVGRCTESVESYIKYMIDSGNDTYGLYEASMKFVTSAYALFH